MAFSPSQDAPPKERSGSAIDAHRGLKRVLLLFAVSIAVVLSLNASFRIAAGKISARIENERSGVYLAAQMLETVHLADLAIHKMIPTWNSSNYEKGVLLVRKHVESLRHYSELMVNGGTIRKAPTPENRYPHHLTDDYTRAYSLKYSSPEQRAALEALRQKTDKLGKEILSKAEGMVMRLQERDRCFIEKLPCLPKAIGQLKAVGSTLDASFDSAYDLLETHLERTESALARLEKESAGRLEFLDTTHTMLMLLAGALVILLTARLYEDIRNAQRMQTEAARSADQASELKSQFVSTVSHEIRTPLNAVLGSASLLRDMTATREQREHVENIVNAGEGLLEIINSVLDISKIEAGESVLNVAAFDIQSLLRDVESILSPLAAQKGLRLDLHASADIPPLLGDEAQLRRVIVNLAGNAIKFTERGQVTVRLLWKNRHLFVDVIDTGIGIPADARERLFKRFSQVNSGNNRRFGGSGLGLYICASLVEQMGGRIDCESEAGRGSRFWFEVPMSEATTTRVTAATAAACASVEPTWSLDRAPRLLLVEDTPSNQLIAAYMLKRLCCEVDLAASGSDALAAIARQPYDLVFMDLQMPDMDGYETVSRIRAMNLSWGRVPIVAMSANAMEHDRQQCLNAGMVDFVPKPVSMDRLREVILRWTGFRCFATAPETPLATAPARSAA